MTITNITNKQSACPACEYERGTLGQPVLKNGLMTCLDCGASWRELGNSLDHILKDTAYDAKSDNIVTPQSIYHTQEDETQRTTSIFTTDSQQTQEFWATRRSTILAALAGFLFLSALVFALISFPKSSQSTRDSKLQITEVDVHEQVRPQGKKVFTVKGTLQNHSNSKERIPRITIILRQTNGREVVRWDYNSPKERIQPGKKLMFASSIQYDTPYVAYAEAIFN